MKHNRAAFAQMGLLKVKDQSCIPKMKARGELKHGGDQVLKPDSVGYRILAELVRRANGPAERPTSPSTRKLPPFFEGVVMLDNRRLLRRVTFPRSPAGFPTEAEFAAVNKDGEKCRCPRSSTRSRRRKSGFYDRSREGFNDIFLTLWAWMGTRTRHAFLRVLREDAALVLEARPVFTSRTRTNAARRATNWPTITARHSSPSR
ncbi:MAG: hypothetical protein U0792_23255 [Gemmataceae bacterium]